MNGLPLVLNRIVTAVSLCAQEGLLPVHNYIEDRFGVRINMVDQEALTIFGDAVKQCAGYGSVRVNASLEERLRWADVHYRRCTGTAYEIYEDGSNSIPPALHDRIEFADDYIEFGGGQKNLLGRRLNLLNCRTNLVCGQQGFLEPR